MFDAASCNIRYFNESAEVISVASTELLTAMIRITHA